MRTAEFAEKLQREIGKIYIGKKEQISLIIMSVFSGGHILLDDLPGSGKTTLIKTLSRVLGCDSKRIQFTPDLLPSDIIGMTVYDKDEGAFRHIKGPVFTNILLADEINRAIPRTQSALLEAMEELQVTIDNETFYLPEPFFVMATQNPVERESTFQLPAAQMDRFFVKLSLGFPSRDEEKQMLTELGDAIDYGVLNVISSPRELIEIRDEIRSVYVSENIKQYIVELVHGTRESADFKFGASPRASRCLYQGGKAYAAMMGRDFVTPEDIEAIFLPILVHRVGMSNDARYTKKTVEGILLSILEGTKVPPGHGEMFDEKSGK